MPFDTDYPSEDVRADRYPDDEPGYDGPDFEPDWDDVEDVDFIDDEPPGIDDDTDFDPYAGAYEQFHEPDDYWGDEGY